MTPLDEITDGYQFQQIIAEYFKCLKGQSHNFHIADIDVDDNGVGVDGGFDIMVEFHYLDVIGKHSKKWIVECKCWNEKNSLSLKHIDTNNLSTLLSAKRADGYLLVCKGTATQSLKTRFRELSENSQFDFKIWEGVPLWKKLVENKGILEAFFPKHFQDAFISSHLELEFEKMFNKYNRS